MEIATLGRGSEIVVPPETRKLLGVGPGDAVVFDAEGDHVILRKAEKTGLDLLDEYAGTIWTGYAEELQRDRDEWDR